MKSTSFNVVIKMTYKGNPINKEEYESNSEIQDSLPTREEALKEKARIEGLAKAGVMYVLTCSENGFSVAPPL